LPPTQGSIRQPESLALNLYPHRQPPLSRSIVFALSFHPTPPRKSAPAKRTATTVPFQKSQQNVKQFGRTNSEQ